MYYLIILMVLSVSYSQELGQWRWADDTMELTHDKEAHLVGSFGFYYLFRHKEFNETQSMLISLGLGLLKETSDAFVPWEKYGAWGGDGFSKYDLYYNIVGISAAYVVDKLWKPKVNKNELKYRLGWNSIRITLKLH
tara:strand:- start:233 stop:643 length:411 start_codon:yes stop_codon:yes gene_type:complete